LYSRRANDSGGCGFAAWARYTPGDSGGDVGGDEAFTGAGVADEERDLADGEFVWPEPFDGLRRAVGGAEDLVLIGALVRVGGIRLGGLFARGEWFGWHGVALPMSE
jgi:hypothetical protein